MEYILNLKVYNFILNCTPLGPIIITNLRRGNKELAVCSEVETTGKAADQIKHFSVLRERTSGVVSSVRYLYIKANKEDAHIQPNEKITSSNALMKGKIDRSVGESTLNSY